MKSRVLTFLHFAALLIAAGCAIASWRCCWGHEPELGLAYFAWMLSAGLVYGITGYLQSGKANA